MALLLYNQGMRKYAAKRDDTERPIIEGLTKLGYSVMTISEAGKPDLLVCKNGQAWLVECKSKGGKLTPAQEKFIATWEECPVIVAKSFEEVMKGIGNAK